MDERSNPYAPSHEQAKPSVAKWSKPPWLRLTCAALAAVIGFHGVGLLLTAAIAELAIAPPEEDYTGDPVLVQSGFWVEFGPITLFGFWQISFAGLILLLVAIGLPVWAFRRRAAEPPSW